MHTAKSASFGKSRATNVAKQATPCKCRSTSRLVTRSAAACNSAIPHTINAYRLRCLLHRRDLAGKATRTGF